MSDLTGLRRSLSSKKLEEFLRSYKNLILGNDLSDNEIGYIMNAIAVFLFSRSNELQKMAYYMAIHLGVVMKDYTVLYDIANMFSYYPVRELIKSLNKKRNLDYGDGFNDSVLFQSLSEVCKGEYYQSEQQYNLSVDVLKNENVMVVAPTSYGKSHLMVEKCLRLYNERLKVCILVPTKSLLKQTLTEIIKKKGDRKYIITHPDMFTMKNIMQPHIAILTQERLLAALTKWENLEYDYIMVDECHNIFRAEERSFNLTRALIIADNRDSDLVKMDFYSPFVAEPETSLSIIGITQKDVNVSKIDEFMKVPKFFVLDEKGRLKIYDQFVDDEIDTGIVYDNYLETIRARGSSKNIIYSNRPRDVELIADEMANMLGPISFSEKSERIVDNTCKTLSSLIGGGYNLIRLLRSGIAISHGKMLDIVKDYIEKLYREVPEIQYMITTSTLLEGVNIPAEKMFILSYSRGRGNLDRSSFQNLIGRVGRFNNIFGSNSDPSYLIPEIYILKNEKYMRADASPIRFLGDGAKEGRNAVDLIENHLLKKYDRNDKDEQIGNEITKLCNMDSSNIERYCNLDVADPKMATTDFGKYCFRNGVSIFNIILYENVITKRLESITGKIKDGNRLIDVIVDCVLRPTYNEVNLNDNNRWVYNIYLNEGLNGVMRTVIKYRVADDYAVAKLIGSSVAKWKNIGLFNPVYVGDMGDCLRDGSKNGLWRKYHVFSQDDRNLMFSYAVGLAKENLDKIEFFIMPIVETLNDLGYVDDVFYKRLKYGTDNDFTIGLLRLGFDISLAKCLSLDEDVKRLFIMDDDNVECIDKDGLMVVMEEKEYPLIYIDEVNSLL